MQFPGLQLTFATFPFHVNVEQRRWYKQGYSMQGHDESGIGAEGRCHPGRDVHR